MREEEIVPEDQRPLERSSTDIQSGEVTRRPTCRLCGEYVVLDDPDDDMSWIHAEDANDRGDHTTEV